MLGKSINRLLMKGSAFSASSRTVLSCCRQKSSSIRRKLGYESSVCRVAYEKASKHFAFHAEVHQTSISNPEGQSACGLEMNSRNQIRRLSAADPR